MNTEDPNDPEPGCEPKHPGAAERFAEVRGAGGRRWRPR